MYKPSFKCEHCGKATQAQPKGSLGGLAHWSLPACGCAESQKAWEKQHREEMERRKKLKRRG